MSWNYRLVKTEHGSLESGVENIIEIKEVYYDEKGDINGYADAFVPHGESVEEVRENINLMLKAFDKPVLKHLDIEGSK